MTKRILLFAISILILKTSSFAQVCTPAPTYTNTSTQNGVYPDTLTNFDPAYVGTPYSQTVTLVIPPDTTNILTFTWDTTVVTSVSGLPSSLTYACVGTTANTSRCSWKGNSIGCILISGTPTTADIGTHNLSVFTNNYIGGNTTANPYTFKGYKIIVSAGTAVSENTLNQTLLQNNPNPFNDKTEISFITEDNGTAQLKIYNLIGSMVQQSDIRVKKGMNKIELNAKNFDAGVYFYSVVSGNNILTRKMIVNK